MRQLTRFEKQWINEREWAYCHKCGEHWQARREADRCGQRHPGCGGQVGDCYQPTTCWQLRHQLVTA